MKNKDLIQKLLQHDMYEDVTVEVEFDGSKRCVQIDSVERVNAEHFPHVGITVRCENDGEDRRALKEIWHVLAKNAL